MRRIQSGPVRPDPPQPGCDAPLDQDPLRARNVSGAALEAWLQVNPDSDAAELLSVLAQEGVLADPENVASTFGEARPGVAYWWLPKDGVAAFVGGRTSRTVITLRRLTPTQEALLRGAEPPAPEQPPSPRHAGQGAGPRLSRSASRREASWGPRTLPGTLEELLALRLQARAAWEALDPRDQHPVQCALERINRAIRGTPKAFKKDRVAVLSDVVLRLLRPRLTPEEIEVLDLDQSSGGVGSAEGRHDV